MQNPKIFLKCGEGERLKIWALAGSACLLSSCPLGAGGRGTPAILLTSAKMNGIPSFCPLSRFALVALLTNMALFRVFGAFLARFGAVVWVCMVCVFCVGFGAFVRVWS